MCFFTAFDIIWITSLEYAQTHCDLLDFFQCIYIMILCDLTGFNVGGTVSTFVSGFLCDVPLDNGWPFIFYTFGKSHPREITLV